MADDQRESDPAPLEVAGLVDRLRAAAETNGWDPLWYHDDLLEHAAATLERLAERCPAEDLAAVLADVADHMADR